MFSLFLFVSSIKMTSTSSLSCFTQDLFHLQLFNSNSDRFSKFSPWFQRQPNLVIWSFPRFHSHGQHHLYFILAFIKFYQTSDQVLFYRIARLKELVKLTRLFQRNPWIIKFTPAGIIHYQRTIPATNCPKYGNASAMARINLLWISAYKMVTKCFELS